jgi:D-alanyl-D-alanine carboxypeptidase
MTLRYLALAALLLGCSVATAGAEPNAPAPSLAARLQAVLDRTAASDPTIPGVLLGISAPALGVEWRGAARGAGAGAAPLSPDQPFRIASITKVYTAAAIFRLAEDGHLGIFDSIASHVGRETLAALRSGGYDPEAITIQQLLAHTSGLYDYAMDADYGAAVTANPQHRWTRSEQIAFAMSHGKPLGAPGERYGYSDTGYVILGEIIERASGEPLAGALRRLLDFRGLGLRSTYFESLEPAPRGALTRARQSLGTTDVTGFDASFDLYGGGGLVSTTADLDRFFRALLQGRLFRHRETLASALMTIKLRHDPARRLDSNLLTTVPFGRRTCWGHGGFWGSAAIYCPDIDVAVSLSINQATPADPEALHALVLAVATEIEHTEAR